MLELLETISMTIFMVVKFFLVTVASLVMFILEIPNHLLFLSSLLNILPPFILPFATAFISISILLFIMNRKVGVS